MKKSLFALGALSVAVSSAHAQSSVTLYGIIDTAIAYSNNIGGHHNFFMNSGNLQGSRWGFRGAEDLGGGLKAIFVLENGFRTLNKMNKGAVNPRRMLLTCSLFRRSKGHGQTHT